MSVRMLNFHLEPRDWRRARLPRLYALRPDSDPREGRMRKLADNIFFRMLCLLGICAALLVLWFFVLIAISMTDELFLQGELSMTIKERIRFSQECLAWRNK